MTDTHDCEICGGTGEYAIINVCGGYCHSVTCPECLGNSKADEESPRQARDQKESLV